MPLGWTPLKTWGPAHWTTTDANTYLRDNMKTARIEQNAQKMFCASGLVVNNFAGFTTYVTHTNLCSTLLDEGAYLGVWASAVQTASSGGVTGLRMQIRDQSANIISGGSWTDSIIRVGHQMSRVGGIAVNLGTNPGFDIQFQLTGASTPTVTVTVTSIAWVIPATGP